MTSSKNTLQELFQKIGKEIPIYNTVRIGGSDHSPMFVSEIILPNGSKITGNPTLSKKKAEKSAADNAILAIKKNYFNMEKGTSSYIEKKLSHV